MKNWKLAFFFLLFLWVFLLPVCSLTERADVEDGSKAMKLWYNSPAYQWLEALPIGNGRLGGMVFGDVLKEHIQFNEDSLWTGIPRDYSNPTASEYLSEIRQLLFEDKQREAEILASETFMSIPLRQERYQPFGDLWIEFDGTQDYSEYRRELDLERAIAAVQYKAGGVTFTRSVFSSYPDQVVVIRLTADKAEELNFSVFLSTPHVESQFETQNNSIVLKGKVSDYFSGREKTVRPSILKFESRLKVFEHNGKLEQNGGKLHITNASEVTLVLTGATSYKNYNDIGANPAARCEKTLSSLKGPYESILKRHIDDHQSLFQRVSIDLGVTEQIKKPTENRILDFQKGHDPHLAALLFQYGRYLLIASSRPGSQPANLQGIWNDRMAPPWESKYTTNINFEMNYWPAELCNLSECHEPMFSLIQDLTITGSKVAKMHYDSRGWVFHHNTDIWRGAAPINASNHGIWIPGGAWMCQHLWWRYQFTLDEDFLRERAYPILKEAALFFVDYLIEDPRSDRGWLISGPSNSPEIGGLVMGPTMDHQIIRNLFSSCIEASEILNVDPEFREKLKELHSRIAPNQIGQYGQLQEWLEDKDDPENKHRHVSHLWGLHPGNEITKEDTPDLFEAAKQSLEMRGDEGTGWSMGWKVNFWARLKDGDRAYSLLNNLMRLTGSSKTEYDGGGVYPNLFDAHPPFQIDGNFGVTSGIAEMLLQSHRRTREGDYILELLPALPSAWPNGHIKGLCARGGFEVDIFWKDGKLITAKIQSKAGSRCFVEYKNKSIELETEKGKSYSMDGSLSVGFF
jgi:alpha-L-fucosidase 2